MTRNAPIGYTLVRMLVLWVVCVGTGFKPASDRESEYFAAASSIELLGEIYREVLESYVDDINPSAFVYAGIDGMLETLDPYTVFLDSEESVELDELTSGRYAGIGVRIARIGEEVFVVSLIEGAEASKAGLRVGDRIVSVDGHALDGKDLDEVKTFIKGPPNSKVTLRVRREGSRKSTLFRLTRREVTVNSVRYAGLFGSTGYFEVSTFGNRSADELSRAIDEVQASAERRNGTMDAVILDLRDNPGGLLGVAVDVAGLFVEKGSRVVSTRGRSGNGETSYRTEREPVVRELPLVVLINERSASASEIVAGAIQELDRGVIVGARSFGKGLVQSIISLPYECTLKMTTSKYYTPSGRLIQKQSNGWDEGPRKVLKARHSQDEKEVFYTRNGRKVYGGGGILPDVQLDDDSLGGYETALHKEGMLFRYANRFRASNDSLPSGGLDGRALMADFEKFLDEREFTYRTRAELQLDDVKTALESRSGEDSGRARALVDSLEQEIVALAAGERVRETDNVVLALEQEILRHYDEDAAIRSGVERDPVVKKALHILHDPKAYRKLLRP